MAVIKGEHGLCGHSDPAAQSARQTGLRTFHQFGLFIRFVFTGFPRVSGLTRLVVLTWFIHSFFNFFSEQNLLLHGFLSKKVLEIIRNRKYLWHGSDLDGSELFWDSFWP